MTITFSVSSFVWALVVGFMVWVAWQSEKKETGKDTCK